MYSYFDAMRRLSKQIELIQRQYFENMRIALKPLERLSRIIAESPYLKELIQDLKEEYSVEYVSDDEAEVCLVCARETLEKYDLKKYVDKVIISGNVIETVSKRIAWMEGKGWTILSETERDNIRKKVKIEHKSRAYAFSALSPWGQVGIIALEVVHTPDNYFIHDVMHEALHLKQFTDYPNLYSINSDTLTQAYEQEIGEKPNPQIMPLIGMCKMIIFDNFIERELLKIDKDVTISSLSFYLQEWLDAKDDFFKDQQSDKSRMLIGLQVGIIPAFLSFCTLKLVVGDELREIHELLSWFPEIMQSLLVSLDDYVSNLRPDTVTSTDVIEIHKIISGLIFEFAEYIGFDLFSHE